MERTNTDGELVSLTTNRPTAGLVGTALADPATALDGLLDTMESHLDQGEGWMVRDDDSLLWFTGRLAVAITADRRPESESLRADIEVVCDLEVPNVALLERLNELNVNAAGWCFWFEGSRGRVISTMRYPVQQKSWWWSWLFLLAIQHQVTVAESIADELAEISDGAVALKEHPNRGARPGVDGWVLAARLGPREPTASLDLFLTTLDYHNIKRSLNMLEPAMTSKVLVPLIVELSDMDGRVHVSVKRHWHPEHGWGWQFATVAAEHNERFMSDVSEPDRKVVLANTAAEWNAQEALDGAAGCLFGCWIGVPELGLVHHSFVPSFVVEKIAEDAEGSLGNVIGLMTSQLARAAIGGGVGETPSHNSDAANDALRTFLDIAHLRLGPIGWSYSADRDHQPEIGSSGLESDELWISPRYLCLCSYGIFNPNGPSVSSLELRMDGRDWILFSLLRNPFGPRIEVLGRVSVDEPDEVMEQLVSDTLAQVDSGPLGGGPDWLEIFHDGYRDAIVDGVRRFAEEDFEQDFGYEADQLLRYSADPWARVTSEDGNIIQPEEDRTDPIEYWLHAIMNRDVIAGHQLFIRSAWEAAKAMVESGPATAELTRQMASYAPRERVLADFEARGSEGPLVHHPLP